MPICTYFYLCYYAPLTYVFFFLFRFLFVCLFAEAFFDLDFCPDRLSSCSSVFSERNGRGASAHP